MAEATARYARQAYRRQACGLLLWLILAFLGQAALPSRALADEAAGTAGSAGSGGGTGQGIGGQGSAGLGSNGPLIASPSVLPATGIGPAGPAVRVGNLGAQIGDQTMQASGGASSGRPLEPTGRAWTLTPSIGLTEEYTTGSQGGGSQGRGNQGGGSQLITTLQPAIVVSGDTTRLHGDLSYTPQIAFYAPDGSQNQVAQNFNARLLATLLPQTLFLDLRGAGAVQSIVAGQAPSDINTLARGDTTQTYSFSASPYAVHRFGPWGTGEIGGSVARTIQSALQQGNGQQEPVSQGSTNPFLADSSNQNVTSTSGHIAFATGEAFSRYSGTALGQMTSFDGAGVLRGAYRDTATLDSGYALTRTITALALVGWERIHYSGSSPIDIDDAIWGVGLRLEPNADSSITIRYNHRDGFNSASLDASYQPTARTRIYARYSTGLATQAEQLQNALATSDLDTLGNPVDHTTGAPLVGVGDFFGTQNSLYKSTVASLTGVLQLDRDTISASVNSQTQTLISASNTVGLANGSTRGVYGTLTWSHTLRPDLLSSVYAQYGTQSGGGSTTSGLGQGTGSGDQQLVAISASLSYALTPTLSGQVRYSYNQTFGGNQFGGNQASGRDLQGNTGQNIVLVSLIKSF